ncbi:DUF4450 domain-containing protein [uncultured Bacteroides sp.]|uniref:DUF4450 domain-containing protein n=1 Tax=uncultured Bacteroides sp. TaxID=162156 RepID=UPI002622A110|nr:DUF4450 domain-containing protein [uncultured Bacteroides sp.]
MRNYILYILFVLLSTPVRAQYAIGNKPQGAGDRIESASFNDHKRGTARRLQYRPDGDDFVCVNGENRYTRALYGSHTAFRVETSDRPLFAVYDKSNSKNICFRLLLPDGSFQPLEEISWCEARYTPGRRSYRLTYPDWGTGVELRLSVLALPDEDAAIWKFTPVHLPQGTLLRSLLSEIRLPKLNRNGDMGADPPGCFDAPEHPQHVQTLDVPLDAPQYILVRDYSLSLPQQEEGTALYEKAEQARAELASRIRITTPDPFFNTLGGALAVAADGIWDGEVWLHGAIGWRMPLSGWRAAYTGDALGWHDRARTHFDAYAASQVIDVPNTIPHPAQDTALALARSVKQWGTPQYSNGYICRNPRRNDQMHHYDMNLCYIDELLWHLNWTGDLDYARSMWPLLTRHLAWEKLNYDPDNDGLYDAYACIWASDALYYNSGAVTHSSAYNYRANRLAAMIAEKIGEDASPYRVEAEKILKALNSRLWMPERGHWAEYQDFMGHKRLHASPGVWTIYHALDSDIADPFQAYLATCYVDREIPHIPVRAEGLEDEGYATISTTNWLPYSWSINNVAFAEVMHTALSYFQAGRADAGFKLLKSSVLDGMYLGESPGNFGQISFYDAARGECYRDFGDPIGVASRVLIQGLYGILPDAMNHRLLVRPGLPSAWQYASLHTPDIDFDFRKEALGMKGKDLKTSFTVSHRLSAVRMLELRFPAQRSRVAKLTVNGIPASWTLVENSVGRPVLSVVVPALVGEEMNIEIEWGGEELREPVPSQGDTLSVEAPVGFVFMQQDEMKWWHPVEKTQTKQKDNLVQHAAFAHVNPAKCEMVVMDTQFNSLVTDIFRNEYLSPRSPYTTLQLPKQGIGEWCHPLHTIEIDDAGLRSSVRNGVLETKLGVSFRTPAEGRNIAFTSLWDNYPDSLTVPLKGKASAAYLLMAGSTNHMQCHIDNGLVRVYYKDGTCDVMPLRNPDNWPPIEHTFFEDGLAFNRNAPALYRLRLKTGEVSNNLGEELGFPGASRELDGGAAVLLEMPLNSGKKLSHLVLETLSNDVVIGVMGITLQR